MKLDFIVSWSLLRGFKKWKPQTPACSRWLLDPFSDVPYPHLHGFLVVSHNLKACQFILPVSFMNLSVPFCSTFLNISGPMGKFLIHLRWSLLPLANSQAIGNADGSEGHVGMIHFTLESQKNVFKLFFIWCWSKKYLIDMGPIHCNDQWDFEVRSYFQRSLCWTQPIVTSQNAPRLTRGDKTSEISPWKMWINLTSKVHEMRSHRIMGFISLILSILFYGFYVWPNCIPLHPKIGC